ncbi:hypothetical protein FACS1894137_03400 [Spirochaetia bacterium]|nr:hypothetical protein FACS1894137_03400 [Spirochaetia bacterium]
MNETIAEFIKMITQSPIGGQIAGLWKGKRWPEKKLPLAETMTLNIMCFYLKMIDLKAFHRLLRNAYQQYFPNVPMSALYYRFSFWEAPPSGQPTITTRFSGRLNRYTIKNYDMGDTRFELVTSTV